MRRAIEPLSGLPPLWALASPTPLARAEPWKAGVARVKITPEQLDVDVRLRRPRPSRPRASCTTCGPRRWCWKTRPASGPCWSRWTWSASTATCRWRSATDSQASTASTRAIAIVLSVLAHAQRPGRRRQPRTRCTSSTTSSSSSSPTTPRRCRRSSSRWSATRAARTCSPRELAWGNGHGDVRRQPPQQQGSRRAEAAARQASSRARSITTCRCWRSATPTGKLRAVVFGYACHATVLSFYQWSRRLPRLRPDRAGEAHPGAVALFWAGCGARPEPAAAPHASSWPRSTASSSPTPSRPCSPAPMTPVHGRSADGVRRDRPALRRAADARAAGQGRDVARTTTSPAGPSCCSKSSTKTGLAAGDLSRTRCRPGSSATV